MFHINLRHPVFLILFEYVLFNHIYAAYSRGKFKGGTLSIYHKSGDGLKGGDSPPPFLMVDMQLEVFN